MAAAPVHKAINVRRARHALQAECQPDTLRVVALRPVEDLLRELADHRQKCGPECVQNHLGTIDDTRAQLFRVPLVHGIQPLDDFRSILTGGVLRPRATQRFPQSSAERYLDLRDVVYTSAGVAYPNKNFALVFSHRLEDRLQADASPWDSGAITKSLCPHLPAREVSNERRDVFAAHRIASPGYREYLTEYVATCYACAADYLCLEPHRFPDPVGALSPSWTSKVFEVRFSPSIPVSDTTLEAVFMPKNISGEAARITDDLRRSGVHVELYRGSGGPTLQRVVRDWMTNRCLRGEH